jgi:thymidylate kinase
MDGAGKSTQIENLCGELAGSNIPVRRLAFWDHVAAFPSTRAKFSHTFLKSDGRVGSAGHPVQRNDKNARAWYLTAGRSVLYLIDAIKLRRMVKQSQANFAGVIVFDRYIYDQLATMCLDSSLGRAYARLLLAIVPRPDVPYVLDAIPEEARERKPEYPLEFLHKYRNSYLQLRELADLTLIEPMSKEEARAAILKKLEPSKIFSRAEPSYSFEPV